MGTEELGKRVQFKVEAETFPGERVAITGNCYVLGNWSPDHVYFLSDEKAENISSQKSPSSDNTLRKSVWSVSIPLPENSNICYRYLIFRERILNHQEKLKNVIRCWETFMKPRCFNSSDKNDGSKSLDKFGFYNEEYGVQRGWLNAESVILIMVSKKSIKWTEGDLDNNEMALELTAQHVIGKENISENLITEVAVLNDSEQNKLHFQNIGGTRLDDFMIFITRSTHPDDAAFEYNFYKSSGNKEGKSLFGRSNSLFNEESNDGEVALPIVNVTGGYCGQFIVKYIKIHPTDDILWDMSITYAKYWNENWKGLQVGHRGTGMSFKVLENNVRENTVGAFKLAADNGADMLEFDVQVTKDGIPIIYHDFHVFASLECKLPGNISENMKMCIHEFTYQQLGNLKLRHPTEVKTMKSFPQDGLKEFSPFPTLETVLKEVDVNVAFNVEIKYPQKLKDGTNEADHPIDMNYFVDRILQVIFKYGGDRYIVFSSFHPDLCIMLRLKQNKYAVLFLTTVTSESWDSFVDPRTTGLNMASYFCQSMDLLGIVAETEGLLKFIDEAQNLVLKKNLILLSYGTDNNNEGTVACLKKMGLHAIIHDRFLNFIKEGKERLLIPKVNY